MRGILSVIIDTGINQDAFEPPLQGDGNVSMTVFVELMDISEEFGESLVDYFFHQVGVMLIAVAYFQCIPFQQLIELLLAGPFILPAA